MAITAAEVKELRERTGSGMMDCKNALEAAHGDMDAAAEALRVSGRAKADKKAGRIAADGVVMTRISEEGTRAVLVEINSETDFVARDENFLSFANAVVATVLTSNIQDVNELAVLPLAGHKDMTVEDARRSLIAKVGENINIRRVAILNSAAGNLGAYSHGSRIGVIVELDNHNQEVARDIAMHVAASKPLVIAPEDVSKEFVDKEKEIFIAQAAGSGKPQDIIEKMVAGKLKKLLDEVSLLGQPFVKDPDMTVANMLAKNRVKVVAFVRFEVGEGIEKETEDFVEAVMAQVSQVSQTSGS